MDRNVYWYLFTNECIISKKKIDLKYMQFFKLYLINNIQLSWLHMHNFFTLSFIKKSILHKRLCVKPKIQSSNF